MNITNDKKGAAVKFPPPLVFISAMFCAYSVQYFWPVSISQPLGLVNETVLSYLGGGVVISGLCIVLFINQMFKRVNTNIEPWKPTTNIINTGVFAYSRSPIYLAFCLVSVGIGMILNSGWVLLSFVPAAIIVYYTAIKKEESYLELKFGEDYLQYKRKVRRWL